MRGNLKYLKEKIFGVNQNNKSKINNYEIYFKNLSAKNGLEIGGPSQIFNKKGELPIYSIINDLDGVNFSKNTVWTGKIEKGKSYNFYGRKKGYQYICDSVNLSMIKDKQYDFLLASHVLEHIANPFKAISEWLRILKDNGIILIILPHKDGTFDHKRPVTDLKHLIEDFELNVGEDDLSHLPEILNLHDFNIHDPTEDFESLKERCLNNYENRCLHHHVFDTKLVIEIINYFKIKIISVDLISPYNIILLGEKIENFQEGMNDKFFDNEDLILKSPFKPDEKI